jgi:hypothetical protein
MMKHLVAGFFLPFTMAAVAQQTPAPQPQVSWVAPQAPEVKRLADLLAGEWTTTEKFEANEFLRNGATGSGVFSIRSGPGGNSVILDYTSQSSMGRYASTRIIYWDRQANRYQAFYCDSLQPSGCGEAGSGTWAGQDLVFESTTEGPGGPIKMRQRFSEISSKGFTFSLDVVNQGKSERSLTIHASRSAAKP